MNTENLQGASISRIGSHGFYKSILILSNLKESYKYSAFLPALTLSQVLLGSIITNFLFFLEEGDYSPLFILFYFLGPPWFSRTFLR